MSMTLYHADSCPFCVRTRLVLHGKGIHYESVQVDLNDKPPLLRELNLRNRVPVIVDGDLVLSESEAIDEYLDEIHPEHPMMPEDPAGRGQVRMMMRRFEDLSDAYYALRRGEDGADLDVAAQLNELDVRLALQPYIAGETYSLADPGYWPWVSRLPRFGVNPRAYASVAAWLDRLEERPEYAAELALTAV